MNQENQKTTYDISPLLNERIAVFPGDTGFRARRLLSFAQGHHLELSTIESTVHLGAHADAPLHYHRNGVSIAERDPMIYVGPSQVISISIGRGLRILPEHLRHLKIEAPRVLFRTGSFPNPHEWNDDFNSLSPELIEFLAAQGVKLVGIDTPSVDPADDQSLHSHQAIYRYDLAILEGLVLEEIPDGLYTLLAQPLRIEGGDASPVRALLLADSGIRQAFEKHERGEGDVSS